MTEDRQQYLNFVVNKKNVERIKIIAFTHKTTNLNDIGKFHIQEDALKERLAVLKTNTALDEVYYLSTCNRVEFIISTSKNIDLQFLTNFFIAFNPEWDEVQCKWAIDAAQVFEGDEALRHLFCVASSIDSLVVGEREIITQVRSSYEKCSKLEITGDLMRLVIKKTIEVAKEVYTQTNIARNPVSVVSLAYRRLRALNVKKDARFLIIGSGVTNSTMAKYLKKHQFSNFTVFNRTLENAQRLANELKGVAYPLSELANFKKGFDIIVTCTGSSDVIITKEIYKALVGDDLSKKVVIDLAIPNDLDAEILENYDVNLIAISNLQEIAKENLLSRERELESCKTIVERNIDEFKQIVRTRKIELAMSEVPKQIKAIRETANGVFAKELQGLDNTSKEVLNKILAYMEKKYISVPMKIAKEILIEDSKSK